MKPKGWRSEPYRHSLSKRGLKSRGIQREMYGFVKALLGAAGLPNLNETEKRVLDELYLSSEGNGHDFGFTNDVNLTKTGITQEQLKGYINDLQKKGFITLYHATETKAVRVGKRIVMRQEPTYQFVFTEVGLQVAEKLHNKN